MFSYNTGAKSNKKAMVTEESGVVVEKPVCNYKLVQFGLATVFPYLSNNRKLELSLKEVLILLKSKASIKFEDLEESTHKKLLSLRGGGLVIHIDGKRREETGF